MTQNSSRLRVLPLLMAVSLSMSLSACKDEGAAMVSKLSPKPAASADAKVDRTVVAEVDGQIITAGDLTPLIANGLDRANAVDRAINRAVAARLAKTSYATQLNDAMRAAEIEIAANVFISNKMQDLSKAVTAADIEQRYNTAIKDADYTGYQLAFALYPSEAEAREGRAAAIEGKPDALKAFQPVGTDKDGKPIFISRNDVPYNLGVFVAKLKEGGFTEPALVRNGYIVLQAVRLKVNPKPTLDVVKDALRQTIADERLVAFLSDARKNSKVVLK